MGSRQSSDAHANPFHYPAGPYVRRIAYTFCLAVLSAAAVLAVGWQVHAEPNRVQFPNLDDLVHYTTVRRGNVTEHIMTTPAAIDAVKQGNPIPPGTHFVLVDHRDGELYRYFVMERGAGWGDDYEEGRRTGDWQFQWFWPDRSIHVDENTARCQSCHSSQASSDYLFTGYRIPRFDGTPVE
jgi:hypothetical protein